MASLPRQAQHFYEFGAFRIDTAERTLLRDNQPVPLTQKAFQTLLVLVENSGHVVEKNELMDRVWPDTFVEEITLAQNISTVRKALGEDKNENRYIETIPRRGYRFVAKVAEWQDEGSDLVLAEHTRSRITIEQSDPAQASPIAPAPIPLEGLPAVDRRERRFKSAQALVIAGAIVILAVAVYFIVERTKHRPPARGFKSIAVLPLKATGENPSESEYLADGISETLITRLTQLPNLRVIPWVTAQQYRQSTKSLQTVARETSVDAIITGSLRRAGDRIAVTVSLVDAESGLQYWADEFEEPLADIFTVQRRIALGAATELKGKLPTQQEETLSQAASHSAEAYEYYLRGKAALKRGGKEANNLAFDLFEKALKLDPNLAEAYAGIGRVQWSREYNGWRGDHRILEEVKSNCQRALDLNPTLANSYNTLISVTWLEGKSEEGLKYGQKVASLGLEDADNLNARANAYYFGALWDKAASLCARVIELDPANEEAHYRLIPTYLFLGEYQKATEAGEVYRRKFGDGVRAHFYTAAAYHCLGDFERAKMHYERAVELAPDDGVIYLRLGSLYWQRGQRNDARRTWVKGIEVASRKLDANPQNPGMHMNVARLNGLLGNRDAVLKEEEWGLRGFPDLGNWLFAIGLAHASLGDSERAAEFLRRGLRSGAVMFYFKNVLKSEGLDQLEQSPAYKDFIKEWIEVVDRLHAQY